MNPEALYWGAITTVGGAMTLIAMYALMVGPFFDGPTLTSSQMMLALGELLVGTLAFAGGAMRMVKSMLYY